MGVNTALLWRYALGLLSAIAAYMLVPLLVRSFLRTLQNRLKQFQWIADVNCYMASYLAWLVFTILLYCDVIFLFKYGTRTSVARVFRYILAVPLILVTACARNVIINALLRYFKWDSQGEGYRNRVFVVRELTNFVCGTLIAIEIFYFFFSFSQLAAFILVLSVFLVALLLLLSGFTMLKNVASGLFLIFAEPLRIGHRCYVMGFIGIVEQISINRTIFRRTDGSIVYIPNGAFANVPQAHGTSETGSIVCSLQFRIKENASDPRVCACLAALQEELCCLDIENVNISSVKVQMRSFDCVDVQLIAHKDSYAVQNHAQTEMCMCVVRTLQNYNITTL